MPAFMLGSRPGTCSVCAVDHTPDMPHNAQSLPYQMRFQTEHGRAATWADAVAHCDDHMKHKWRERLAEHWSEPAAGVDVIAEPHCVSDGKPIPMPSLEPKVVKMERKKRGKKI